MVNKSVTIPSNSLLASENPTMYFIHPLFMGRVGKSGNIKIQVINNTKTTIK